MIQLIHTDLIIIDDMTGQSPSQKAMREGAASFPPDRAACQVKDGADAAPAAPAALSALPNK